MNVTTEIKMDLVKRGIIPVIDAVQGDALTRQIRIVLYSGGTEWIVPDGITVLARFTKPDGTGGTYDKLPGGAAAYTVSGNTVTVVLVPQVTTVSGAVFFSVTLVKGDAELTTFTMTVNVQKNNGAASAPSGNYVSVSGLLPGPVSAKPGQYLKVTEVDAKGSVIELEAVTHDTTLSVSGVAADAAAVGQQIRSLSDENAGLKDELIKQDGVLKINIIGTEFDDNHYRGYTSGALSALAGWCCTKFISVIPNQKYNFSENAHICFFDSNYNHVSGTLTHQSSGDYTTGVINVPTNAKFLTCSLEMTKKESAVLIIGEEDAECYAPNGESTKLAGYVRGGVVHVGLGYKYTSILKALKESTGDILVHAGNYEISTEYTRYYGSGFWANYVGYDGNDDPFMRGLYLTPGRKITFEANTSIIFDPAPETVTDYMKAHFSIFAPTYNNEINYAHVYLGGVYCEYFIHDDFSNYQANDGNVYKGCVFNGTPYGNACIGGGCGTNGIYVVEDCLFLNNNGVHDISYHNTTAGGTDNRCKIYVTNCYGSKKCAFRWYGEPTAITDCIVSNCHFSDIVCEAMNENQQNENMRLIAWNNVSTN